eukprot:s2940_g2.t1
MAAGPPSEAEELLLWEEITACLRGAAEVDSAVLRLKLVLQLHRHGQGPPDGWNPEADFLLWLSEGREARAGRLLTLEEDVALLDFLGGGSHEAGWQLRARTQVHRELLQLSSARGHVTQRPGRLEEGTVVVLRRSKHSSLPGRHDRGKATLESASHAKLLVALEAAALPPDAPGAAKALSALLAAADSLDGEEGAGKKTGVLAVSWLLRRLPLQLSRDFLLLYELLTGSRSVWLLPSDDPALTGQLLACLVPPAELSANPALAGLLRALAAKPELAERLPKYRGGMVESFAQQLSESLSQQLEALKLPPSPAATRFVGRFWSLERKEGVWHSIEAVDEKAADESPSTPMEEDTGSPLSNAGLVDLLQTMSKFGDTRLPSTTWDFDCRRRGLLTTPTVASPTATPTPPRGAEGLFQGCRDLEQRLPNLAFSQLPALTSKPLKSLDLARLITTSSEKPGADKDVASIRSLALDQGPAGRTVAGKVLLKRLEADFKYYAGLEESSFWNITPSTATNLLQDKEQLAELLTELERLQTALRNKARSDTDAMYEAMATAKNLANTVRGQEGAAIRLARLVGAAPTLSFQDILQVLLVRGGTELLLPHLCPMLTGEDIRDLAAAAVLALLLSSRALLCRRALAALGTLKALVERAKKMDSSRVSGNARRQSWWRRLSGRFRHEEDDVEEDARGPELCDAAGEVAAALGVEAHSVEGMTYDPRLVLFEFVAGLVLRKKQVELVRAMQAAVEEGRPLVHQMLMGQGKTTVVTPLTILVHGTSTRACVVCCPSALLEFTCKVLRERLCGVLFRPVVEFHFTRSTPVSDDHVFKLLHAQASRAVLCSGPTALKSLLLRFVLTLHAIDVAQSKEVERTEVNRSKGFLGSSMKSLLSWPSFSGRNAAAERLEALRFEASALRWALGVFRGAVLLLDDIDLLMHPLRSELHWPLGDQHKLDFTSTASGVRELSETPETLETTSAEPGQASGVSFASSGAVGARWQLGFHLLDGFFSCQAKAGPAVASLQGVTSAQAVLARLKAAVERGLRRKALQRAPHLVLLSPDFYHKELRPILAEWALIWIRRRLPSLLLKLSS